MSDDKKPTIKNKTIPADLFKAMAVVTRLSKKIAEGDHGLDTDEYMQIDEADRLLTEWQDQKTFG